MENFAYRNILVATDYSDLSENAVSTAAAICRKQERFTDPAARRQGFTGVHTDGGIPPRPDLVLIGTHGASGFRRFFIGSTACRVLKNTRFPVPTVPGEGDWTPFRNLLFPIRLVPDALQKYDIARPMIRADMPFVHILGLSMESDPESVQGVFEMEEELETRLTEDGVTFDVCFQHCHHYVDKILEVAEKRHADLIPIIATIFKSKGEFFIGPFSQQILRHAKVPVLCVRTGE